MAEKKNKFSDKARQLGQLPAEKKRAALEISTALAGVSLRVSRAFVAAVPEAAEILLADDLRLWGELGRRLAMGSADTGVKFFASGVSELKHVPERSRAAIFQVCTRQLVLSSSIALETFQLVPAIATKIKDDELLARMLDLAVEVAQRSAKHSAEFIEHTPAVAAELAKFGGEKQAVIDSVLALASQFASRTGGMTADLWANLPASLSKLSAGDAVLLMERAVEMLEFGGSVTLYFVSSGSDVLQSAAYAFDDWCTLARTIALHGNAVLISFLRATPKVFASFGTSKKAGDISRVLQLTAKIATNDAESALAAFKSSVGTLKKVSIEQFEEWVDSGILDTDAESLKARRSYFALETRASNERLQETRLGLSLEKIQGILRMYVEALTGREVEIAPLSAMPQESRIGDGKTIFLPASVAEFEDDDMNFRLYKVLAAHAAGQIEFGTFERDTTALKAAFSELHSLYSATADERDAFSLDGYLDRSASREPRAEIMLPSDSDYTTVLSAFPEPRLARKIFGTMENARIDARLRQSYRGLVKDLDLMQSFLRSNRPYIFDLPMHQVPFELLFQMTLCSGATDDAKRFYGQVVSEIETVIESCLITTETTVADSVMATSRVYNLFQNISPEQSQEAESDNTEEKSEFAYDDKNAAEAVTQDQVKLEQRQEQLDIRDLFNAWNSLDEEGEPDDLQGAEAWSQNEMPEQALEPDDIAFAYDEWDRELNDYRVGWSRVIEKRVTHGDRNFVELAAFALSRRDLVDQAPISVNEA